MITDKLLRHRRNLFMEIQNSNEKLNELINFNNAPLLLEIAEPYFKLMNQYRCAMLEIKTKLEVLNIDLSIDGERNPFESIQCRIKRPESIVEKLGRSGHPVTIENIEKYVHDVAGIRVICSFPDDIYMLADKLGGQDDVIVVERKDYIANPKPSGYRSLHLIVDIPIFLFNETKHMLVEVQFRTIAMDFWASLEHKVKYKKNLGVNADEISKELRECAEDIARLDTRMQNIKNSAFSSEK